MATIVTVANGKGGVGKSTITIGKGLYAARCRMRTLLVDMDFQSNMTASFVLPDDSSSLTSSYDLMCKRAVSPTPVSPNLDLLPATIELEKLDRETDPEIFFQLGDQLREQLGDKYDLILIDTPGNISVRLRASLVAADFVFSPSEASRYGNQALGQLSDVIKTTRRRLNPDLNYLGVVMNKVKGVLANGQASTVTERDIIEEFLSKNPGKLIGTIGWRGVFRDSFSEGKWLPNDENGRKAEEEFVPIANRILSAAGFAV